jgi:hypothetical protein
VHRDLKPANLFVERRSGQDFAKVADFGIAKVIGEEATALTQAGGSMGTPRYMAPEQWTGKSLDARADLYSLGIILFEMLSGAPPFTGNLQALMYKHLHEEIPPLPAGTPPWLADLVRRLLAKSPDDRPASAAAVLQALASIEPKVSDPPTIQWEPSEIKTTSMAAASTDVKNAGRARAGPYAALLVAVLSVGAAFVFFRLQRKPALPLAALPKPPREPAGVEPTPGLEPARATATSSLHSQAEDWRKRGEAYERGDGVPQSDEEAAKWFRKAAEQGDAAAELGLSVLYTHGRGVPHDHDEALKWLRKAAAQRLPEAQFALGLRYANGIGVARDDAQAARWFREAAEQGFPQGALHLGFFYAQGRGVPQDFTQAAKWYRRAADQGFAPAELNLGLLYESGQGVPLNEGEAVDWFRKAARQGNERAQANLTRRHEAW